jgi:hypothetical protein
MIGLAASAILSVSSATPLVERPAPAAVTVQAQATIRVISGARIHFGQPAHPDLPPPRQTLVRVDGATRAARLVEFE